MKRRRRFIPVPLHERELLTILAITQGLCDRGLIGPSLRSSLEKCVYISRTKHQILVLLRSIPWKQVISIITICIIDVFRKVHIFRSCIKKVCIFL